MGSIASRVPILTDADTDISTTNSTQVELDLTECIICNELLSDTKWGSVVQNPTAAVLKSVIDFSVSPQSIPK